MWLLTGSVPDASDSGDGEESATCSANLYILWTDIQLWNQLSNNTYDGGICQ